MSAIHSARQQLKKLRGLLRLVRGSLDPAAYERQNACFRDVGREPGRSARSRGGAGVRRRRCSSTTRERLRASEFDAIERALKAEPRFAAFAGKGRSGVRARRFELRRAQERMTEWPLVEDDFESVAKGLFATLSPRAARCPRRGARAESRRTFTSSASSRSTTCTTSGCWKRLFRPSFTLAERRSTRSTTRSGICTTSTYCGKCCGRKPKDAPPLQLFALTALVDRRRHELAIDAETAGRAALRGKTQSMAQARAQLLRPVAIERLRPRASRSGPKLLPRRLRLRIPAAHAKRSITA